MIFIYTWLAVAISALMIYFLKVYTKLSRAGVNHLPIVPLFGHIFWVLFRKEHAVDSLTKSIDAFPDDKIIGYYDLVTPLIIVKDLETMKRITIKDFEHFVDRRKFFRKDDPVFGRALLTLTGDEWKAMRSTLSPAFTSSKIRLMVPSIMEVGEMMVKLFKQRIQESGKNHIDIKAKEVLSRYSNDVIASCAFGLNVDSQSMDNQFFTMGKEFSSFSLQRVLKGYVYRCLPSLIEALKVTLVPRDISNFFTEVFLGTMKNREKNHIIRHDLINILIEVKKGKLMHEKFTVDPDAGFATVEESSYGKTQHNREWSDTDLVAQAFLFLFAGLDTVSTAMSHLLHELAVNPEVQDRLAQEIREHHAKNGGKFDYSSVQSMTYLDMVVSEGLRLWPPTGFINRLCVKDYNIGRPNNQATKDLIIRKDDVIVFPIWAFHRNPDLFPNPLKFDPERFSPENRQKIKPLSYMPFGVGPRNCIGSRFALCEIKVMLCQLLHELEVYPCATNGCPEKLIKYGFDTRIEKNWWISLRVRPEKQV